jgi:hypothetical protein
MAASAIAPRLVDAVCPGSLRNVCKSAFLAVRIPFTSSILFVECPHTDVAGLQLIHGPRFVSETVPEQSQADFKFVNQNKA